MKDIEGYIHSFESGGMVDGPGLRFVAFLQGCPLRCLYCHNPDSWKFKTGRRMTAGELVAEAMKYKMWMDSSGGGITLSGGEALSQADFAEAIFRVASSRGIHGCLDTSGFGPLSRTARALDAADLVILDIKAADGDLHKRLTGVDLDPVLATLKYLTEQKKPLWIRHVVAPGLTDRREDLEKLLLLVKAVPTLQRFEFLPFHKLGEPKWAEEGLRYTLSQTPVPEPVFMEELRSWFTSEGLPL